jgi:leucine dehydrogenase
VPAANDSRTLQSLWSGEQLSCCYDPTTGLRAVIAIDDTTLGPGLGGVRYAVYSDEWHAIEEATRLATAMTLKNAVAGVPYGGAKCVILADRSQVDRAAVMRALGRFIARHGGDYVPGVDVGTTVGDLAEVARVASDVACHDADPSPWTALGVLAAIRAAVAHECGTGLTGVRVAVQGAGHVGSELVRLLRADGAEVSVADIDPTRAVGVATLHDARVVDPDAILSEPCDVLAPCAMGRVLDDASVALLRCKIVAGAANDTLASHDVAFTLAERAIRYVPDFVANAGGVIQIHALRSGWDDGRLTEAVAAIGDRVTKLLTAAEDRGVPPLEAAEALAEATLRAGRASAGVAA